MRKPVFPPPGAIEAAIGDEVQSQAYLEAAQALLDLGSAWAEGGKAHLATLLSSFPVPLLRTFLSIAAAGDRAAAEDYAVAHCYFGSENNYEAAILELGLRFLSCHGNPRLLRLFVEARLGRSLGEGSLVAAEGEDPAGTEVGEKLQTGEGGAAERVAKARRERAWIECAYLESERGALAAMGYPGITIRGRAGLRLEYPGSLLVEGELSGADVRVGGDLVVAGSAQDCALTAGGSILIAGVFRGAAPGGKARAEAGREFACRVVEDARVMGLASITVDDSASGVRAESSGPLRAGARGKGACAGGVFLLGQALFTPVPGDEPLVYPYPLENEIDRREKIVAKASSRLNELRNAMLHDGAKDGGQVEPRAERVDEQRAELTQALRDKAQALRELSVLKDNRRALT